MRRIGITLLASFLLASCLASAVNEYGLVVIGSAYEYETTVLRDPARQLVELREYVPRIVLDIRYATEDNFLRRKLYPAPNAWLRLPAALALRDVQSELARHGLGLKVYDAYRPYSVTRAMWEPIRNPDYVADPAKGSRHNRGAAVDVSLVTLPDGSPVPMPTEYDDFSPRASHAFTELPVDVIARRELLRDVMERHGFAAFEPEWWHYDYRGWEKFELLDVGFADLGEPM